MVQAEKQGWEYQVQTPHEPKIPAKNYGEHISQYSISWELLLIVLANNYVHVPGKLRIHHTK